MNIFSSDVIFTGPPFTIEDPEGEIYSEDEYLVDISLVSTSNSSLRNYSLRNSTVIGISAISFMDDLYGKIYAEPETIRFGNIVRDSNVKIDVWNAGFDQNQLDSISQDFNSVIIGPRNYPKTFQPFESFVYEVSASKDGDPIISGKYAFSFSSVIGPSVEVTGIRIVLFPYKHNWKYDVRESWKYYSGRIRATNGKEQVFGKSKKKTILIRYVYTEYGVEMQNLISDVTYGSSKKFSVPLWQYGERISNDIFPGDTDIYFDTIPEFAHVEGLIYLGEEPISISSIDKASGKVTVSVGVSNGHSAGEFAYPMLDGFVSDTDIPILSPEVTDRVSISFEFDYDLLPHEFSNYYAQIPIYDEKVSITPSPSLNLSTDNVVRRISSGIVNRWLEKDYVRSTYKLSHKMRRNEFVLLSRKIDWLVDNSSKVLLKPPAHIFTALGNISSGDNYVSVKANNSTIRFDLIGIPIYIISTNGQEYYRTITDVSVSGNVLKLLVDSSFTQGVIVSEIGMLLPVRVLGNGFSSVWKSKNMAVVNIGMESVI